MHKKRNREILFLIEADRCTERNIEVYENRKNIESNIEVYEERQRDVQIEIEKVYEERL